MRNKENIISILHIPAVNSFRLVVLLLFFFLQTPTLIIAQAPYSSIDFQHIGGENSIGQSTVYAMYQDKSGFIWAGTQQDFVKLGNESGHTRYNLSNSEIVGNLVQVILQDKEDNLWTGTDMGLSRYNHQQDSFDLIFKNKEQLGSKSINTLYQDDLDRLWIGTDSCLVYYKDGNWGRKLLEGQSIKKIIKGLDSYIYVGTADTLFRLDTRDTTFAVEVIENLKITSMYRDMADTLWIGSTTGRVYRMPISQGASKIDTLLNLNKPINVICEDLAGNIWVGSRNGITIFHPDRLEDRIIVRKNLCNPRSLKSNDVFEIIRDEEGVMWVGTFAGGASRFDSRNSIMKSFFKSAPAPNQKCYGNKFVWAILKDSKSDIWLGTRYDGLIKYDYIDEEFKEFPLEDKNGSVIEEIRTIAEDKNKNIWIGSSGGVFRKRPEDKKPQRVNDYNAVVIKEGLENDFWIGTIDKGLKRCDRQGRLIESFDNKDSSNFLSSAFIYSLYVDSDSSIWVGTYIGGLNKIERINGSYQVNENPLVLDASAAADSIKNDAKILCIAKTEGPSEILWVGTSGYGLYAIDLQKKTYIDSLHLKINKDGDQNTSLPSNTIYSIQSHQNKLWFSTSNGLVLLNYTAPKDSAYIQVFTEEDGLQNKEGNAGASFKDEQNNKLYFGGISGFNEINPDAVGQYKRSAPFKIYVQDVSLKDKTCKPGCKVEGCDFVLSKSAHLLDTLTLKSKDLPLKLDLVSLNYNSFQSSRFQVNIIHNGEVTPRELTNNTFSLDESDIYDLGAGEFQLTFSHWNQDQKKWVKLPEGQQIELIIIQTWREWGNNQWKKYFWYILFCMGLAVAWGSVYWRQYRKAKAKRDAEIKAEIEAGVLAKKKAEARTAAKEKELADQERQQQEMRAEVDRQTSKLRELPPIINNVSRQDTIDEICQTTCQHLVDYFGFDYASIALGDYLINRIRIKKLFINPEESDRLMPLRKEEATWKKEANFSFNDCDILPAIFSDSLPNKYRINNSLIFNVNGPLINGQEVDMEAPDSPIKKEIYDACNHKDLNRFFLRLTQKQKEKQRDQEEPDFPLGVIEAGYYKRPEHELTPIGQARLRLFVDNCAQPYFRTYRKELTEDFIPVAKECAEESTYHKAFQTLVNQLVWILGADKGFLGFLSLNEERFYIGQKNPIVKNYNATEIRQLNEQIEQNHDFKDGAIWDAISSKESQLSHGGDALYHPQAHSQLVIPLINEEETIGTLVLLSSQKLHFNKFQISFLEDLVKNVVEVGYRQKLLSKTSDLIFPFNLYSSREETYQTLIEKIQEYLYFNTIGVWERVEVENGKPQLRFAQGSKKLLEIPQAQEDNFIDQNSFIDISSTTVISTENLKSKKLNKVFSIKKHFKTIICIPLNIDRQQEGQIVIFSKRILPNLFSEDRVILNNIASKAAITILSQELFETFRHFSEDDSIATSSPENILEDLLDTIKREMHADHVILFWKDKLKTTTNLYNIVYKGQLKHPLTILTQKTISTKPGDLANTILDSNENPILVHNEEEYFRKLSSRRNWHSETYEKEFFVREELSAMVALKLSDNSGILFLNYTSKRPFGEFFQKKLKAFGFLTTNSIRQSDINQENRQLKQSNININKEAHNSHLATEIAHNSGNIVTALSLSYADMASDVEKYEKEVDKKRVLQFLEELERPITQLNVDFDRLKDYRSTVDQPKEDIRLRPLIENALDLLKYTLRKRNKVKIDFRKNGPNPEIWCNSRQISSVIINIIINALEAIPKKNKGLITITTEANSAYAIIKIRDDGPGISPDIRMNIFKPNYSTKPFGTGIGLSSSKFIIEEEHEGLLEIGFEDRKGAAFIIKLPLDITKTN